jgi:hypothetical protein
MWAMGAAEKVVPADAFSQGDVLQGKYTVEQFLAWMRIRPERFELHGDRIVCMSGTKKEHREAVRTLDEEIQKRKPAGCHVDIADAIKATTGTSPYYFPDLIMVCGPQEYEDVDGIDVLENGPRERPTRASSSKATSGSRVSSWSYSSTPTR